MDEGWYESAIELVRKAHDDGKAAFVIHTLDNGDIRLVGLSLPAKLVAQMLHTAARQYEAEMPAGTLN